MKKLLLIFISLLALSLTQCRSDKGYDLISAGDMEELLYDYYVSSALAFQAGNEKDSVSYRQQAYFAAVLKKHGVTRAQFDSSMVYYYRHAKELSDIYQNVTDRLMAETGSEEVEKGDKRSFRIGGDTAMIWNANSSAMLMTTAPLNRMDFSIKCDTSFHKGDDLELFFNSNFLMQDGGRDVAVIVACSYDNDSTEQTTRHITSDGFQTIRVKTDKKRKLKSLHGTFYMCDTDPSAAYSLRVACLRGINMIRMHDRTVVPEPEKSEKADTLKKDSLKIGEKTL